MLPGVPERRSFDYVRHGTVDLFAALDTATGKVITKLSAQHRAVDFRDFLDEIDRQTQPGLAVHVICDNLSARKAPVVHTWLLAHPRFHLHLTPHLLAVDQPGRAVVRAASAAGCSQPPAVPVSALAPPCIRR
ncbi:transposase [Streptomyces coeruleorubidus]|uniref:Transposase n=1 Tax=Streptomyces coeruleorubidus TaxID=116188 RepID=A0ABZ0KPJ5_STRC4|nr:transposase [Streptomyces coeruleorubidus]WOT39571.1 transposase [Streptomyces coeruleorubidus]